MNMKIPGKEKTIAQRITNGDVTAVPTLFNVKYFNAISRAIENKDPEMLKAIKDMRGLPSVLEDILKIALKHPAKMKGNRAFGNMLTVENVSNVNAVTEISKFLNNERVEHAVLVVAIGELGARGNKILLDKVNEYLNGISHIPKANEVRKAVEKAVIAAENYQDPDKKNRANERVSIVYTREI